MKLKTLTLATSLALSAMTVAGSAQATALATSILNITGFTISDGSGQLTNGAGGLVLGTTTDSASISAQLGSALPTAQAQPSVPLSAAPLDLGPVSQGTVNPAYTNNTFAILSTVTPAPVSDFALADSYLAGAPINGTAACAGPGCSNQAGQASYVSLLSAPLGGIASASNGLHSAFLFTAGNSGPLSLSFNALAYLEAFTSPDSKVGSSAGASYSLSFSVRDNSAEGAQVILWTPNGDSTDNGAIGSAKGITAQVDDFSLNQGLNASSPFPFTADLFYGTNALCVGVLGCAMNASFSATTVSLTQGHAYLLEISSTTNATANTVPEPETLALFGVGLLGLGMSLRKREAV